MSMIDSIDRFIDSRFYHYALLINGKWGSGKTFFVTEKLIPHLREKEKKVLYLSLYGIKSTDEISQTLCIQAIKGSGKIGSFLDSKGGQITSFVASTMIRLGLSKIGASDDELKNTVAGLQDYDRSIIIFDDLERCGCDVNEVLGYINNFVEHSDASVILVANEEEIGKWQLDRNPELQMLVAMDNRIKADIELSWEEAIRYNSHSTNNHTPIDMEKWTPDQLEQRRKIIFRSNERYRRIKEKVIGQTLDFEPELKSIFNTLIENNIKEEYIKKALLKQIDSFVKIAEKDEHKNIRTFQFFLEKISVIYNEIKNQYPTLTEIILRYTYRSSIRYMKGLPIPVWDGDCDYGNQEFGKISIVPEAEMGFKFIDDLIETNTFDSSYVHGVLATFARLAEMKGKLNNDPYQLSEQWYTASDDELGSWLDDIEQKIRRGYYSTELFTNILRRIATLYTYNVFREKCVSIHKAMKDFITSADPVMLVELEHEHFLLEGDVAKKYREYREQIDELIKQAKKESEKQLYETLVSNIDQWGTNLEENARNHRNINQGHSFVYWLEPEKIVNLVIDSSNYELQQFRFAMHYIYDDSMYYENRIEDLPHLTRIQELLKEKKDVFTGQVQFAMYNWITSDINRYVDKFKLVD